ncbi:ABC transporter substrate-binding protein [Nostoc calcicola FACHB-3891]|nr:ABC transporter substrate-binding protein [Nostoc calcicola FACHB-3891]
MNNFTARRNPYIIGRPIFEPEKFFGREELFQFIEDNLIRDVKFIFLHGQRRIGRSSVLQQIPHKIAQDKFVFVTFDLQEHSQSSLGDILHSLAEAIAENIELDSEIIPLPYQEQFNNNPDIFSDEFLPQIYQRLGNKNLVLLLDEFDVVGSNNSITNQGGSFFKYLQLLLKQEEKLFIIPVLGRFKDDLQNLLDLFKNAPFQEVGLLNDLSAKRLITKPAQGILEYEEDAIKAILELTSGHPYFTQAICFNLFLQAKIADKFKVNREDVNSFIDKTIESVQAGLAWFWDGLSINEKVVFSAVAESQQMAIEQKLSFPEDPLKQLKNYGVIQTEELNKATKQLVQKGYLDDTEVRVKIELVRRWLVKYYPLNREIFQLEEIKQEEINQVYQQAKILYKQGKIQEEINHYENILKLNPNHFSTIPILAESYLDIKNFDKALTFYKRAYQADPIRNKEGFLLVGEKYGEYLIKKGELSQAKIQFEAVLEIESDRKSARDKLREIEAIIEQQQLDMKSVNDKQKIQIYPFVLLVILIIIAITSGIISIIIYQSLTSCPQGQQKLNDECVTNVTAIPIINDTIQSNISSGDRTLFFTIPDIYRDQGIEEFKQGNYPEAIKLFQQAITANRSDPEVRIYYNNAIARQRGNPFTLAVVVPAENGRDRAQEILRGVAQSQEQFNANGGQDGRSLEIVIANDGDDEKKAQQIAQYLVNDKSVLGVIGHGSSKTTKPALDNVYEQAGIPFISPISSANTLQGKNFFRTTPSDAAFGEKLAQYAIDSGLNKVVIVYNSDNPYSNSLKGKFENKFTGQIISQIDLNKKTLNIEQELQDSASQQVQAVILLPNVEHIAAALDIAKENANKNLGLKLLGGDALYNQKTLQDGGNAVEGLVIAVPWFRDAPEAKSFSQAAKQMWGGDISWRTATSYDAAQAFINSLSAQPSRETILQKLRQTNLSAKLTSGNNLKFQKGERQSEAVLVKVESGRFTCLDKCLP